MDRLVTGDQLDRGRLNDSVELALKRGDSELLGAGDEAVLLHRLGKTRDRILARLHIQIDQHELLGAEARDTRLRVVAVWRLGRVRDRIVVGEEDAPAARASHEVLRYADLLPVGDRHLHAADGAAVVAHGRDDDVALLVKAVVESRELGVELALERGDRVVEGIEVTAVTGLVVLVSGEDQLLELAEDVDLAFHLLSSRSV